MGSAAVRATVGVVGSESLFGWVGVGAGWIGRATAGGGVAGPWVRGWRTGWRTR